MSGLRVKMDGADLSHRDFIIGIEFDNMQRFSSFRKMMI